MADVTAGTQTSPRGDRRNGQQDRSDRLGRSDPQPTLHAAHCLRGKEQ